MHSQLIVLVTLERQLLKGTEELLAHVGHAYAAVISACAMGAEWQKAEAYFREMTHRGIQADVVSCTALITALASGGQWEKAKECVDWMQQQSQPQFLQTHSLERFIIAEMVPQGTQERALSYIALGQCLLLSRLRLLITRHSHLSY